jgi:hypothetical protein
MTHPRCTRCGAPGMDIITSREPDMSNAEMLREPAVETLRGDTFDMKLEVIVLVVRSQGTSVSSSTVRTASPSQPKRFAPYVRTDLASHLSA